MRMLRATAALVATLAFGADAHGQIPAFDAASVKRRTEPGGGSMGRQPGGRFTAQGVSLQDLIVFLVEPGEGKHGIAILVDSPSRVTAEGAAFGRD